MIRVLLVEDDPVIRDTTCYFLKSQQNFEVVCAETGGDALSHAREMFDVILMDILLPDTNGVDLCQRLRSWHHCPIIFTSCLDDTDTIVRALEMGGDDFLTKPYNNKILLARIMATPLTDEQSQALWAKVNKSLADALAPEGIIIALWQNCIGIKAV